MSAHSDAEDAASGMFLGFSGSHMDTIMRFTLTIL